ncbi:MAG: sulfurtransferase complex subunit TusB [Rhodospirillaceae bacterium]|mgnify:FL=1|jgi:tRNA 2-thiouridine synthesizing protein B|nr:sulfurtransferase complex subunit TusB [Rhodospirillaceae bacterium]MBT4219433.1 sulfurtransferase complex subunit TusB [Rhodospirillaceae bacterium]MBT4463782.1 sulfurtransferase complex subunit TusB [Rhodospirillaceae bacterium]MBT5013429.1 sulfurtransferase complex subunit TusB [Rhodospirillaceae bacterium]MBT5308800.1 sulfurtransferase complex subunit TusB [Rhodospirillaceae bacterium]
MIHTVNKSPFERNSLDSCIRLSEKGSPILLLEDGVYAATSGTNVSDKVSDAAKDHPMYVMGPDLEARGIASDKIMDGITVVDYGGFVDLVVEHGAVNSWL